MKRFNILLIFLLLFIFLFLGEVLAETSVVAAPPDSMISSQGIIQSPRSFNPFWQNFLSTFMGAILGFIFSLALFYITRVVAQKSDIKILKKNLNKEFEFNIYFLKNLLNNLNGVIEKITANNKNVWFVHQYEEYQRVFTQAYFQRGLLYDRLTPKELSRWSLLLVHMVQGTVSYLMDQLEKWKADEITQQEASDVFIYERNCISDYLNNVLPEIKEKILGK